MKCDVIRDLMPLYIDGCLSDAGAELVGEHLEGCADCRRMLVEMRRKIDVSEEEITDNLSEKELFEEGKEIIERRVRQNYEIRGVAADTLINLLLMAVFAIVVRKYGWSSILDSIARGEGEYFLGLSMLPMYMVWTVVCLAADARFLAGRAAGRDTPFVRALCVWSIGFKMILLGLAFVMAVILMCTGAFL